jgi:hypothetical protein
MIDILVRALYGIYKVERVSLSGIREGQLSGVYKRLRAWVLGH